MSLVLRELQPHPYRLTIVVAMPVRERLDCFLSLASGVKPSRALREEEGEDDDETREDHLQPDGDQPGVVVFDVQSTTDCTRGKDGTDKPGGIAKAGDDTAIPGMSSLDNPDRTGSGGDRDTKPEQKSTAHHLAFRGVGRSGTLNDGADNNTNTASDHADSSTEGVNSRTNERKGTDTANLIHGGDQTSPNSLVLAMKMRKEVLLIGQQTTKQHGVETVHCLAKEADEEREEEQHSPRLGQRNWLLQ